MKLEHDHYATLLGNCFIALKNISLYPPGHSQLTHCIDHAYETIAQELKHQAPLTFGVAREVLIHGDEPIAPGMQSLKNFAKRLTAHDIASFTFHKGLEKESLIRFFQLLSTPPEEAAGDNGIAQTVQRLGIKNIELLTIDYNLFLLSTEDETSAGRGETSKQQRENIWIAFTKRLLQDSSHTMLSMQTDGSAGNAPSADPVKLARFINENDLASETNLEHFGEMLDAVLGANQQQEGGVSPAAADMRVEDFSMVGSLLGELNPALRKQFLSMTLDKCQENVNSGSPKQLLSLLSQNLVHDILDLVNEAEREISPALLLLIEGLSFGQTASVARDNQELSSQAVEVLMAKEKYEEYVEPEYSQLLRILGQNQNTVAPPCDFSLADYDKTFAELYLVDHTVALLLALMEATDSEKEYEGYGKELVQIAFELPSLGIFSLVDKLTKRLVLHTEKHHSSPIRKLAETYLEKVESREYVEKIATFLPEASGKDQKKVVHALMGRGRQAVAELLDVYPEEQFLSFKPELERFFASHRVDTLAEIVRRVAGVNVDTLLLLLALAKRLGVSKSAATMFRPLLHHHEDEVRQAALSLLRIVRHSKYCET